MLCCCAVVPYCDPISPLPCDATVSWSPLDQWLVDLVIALTAQMCMGISLPLKPDTGVYFGGDLNGAVCVSFLSMASESYAKIFLGRSLRKPLFQGLQFPLGGSPQQPVNSSGKASNSHRLNTQSYSPLQNPEQQLDLSQVKIKFCWITKSGPQRE